MSQKETNRNHQNFISLSENEVKKVTTRIMTSSVRMVVDNGFYYVGKVIAEKNGHITEFAIKTHKKNTEPEVVMVKQNSNWVTVELHHPLIVNITTKFSNFVNLVISCFGSKYKRNILFLKDRFLRDLTSYRMRGSSRVSQYICLVENNFYRVNRENLTTEYYYMPIDMSQDWQKIEQLPATIESRVLKTGYAFAKKLAISCIKYYHKEKILHHI